MNGRTPKKLTSVPIENAITCPSKPKLKNANAAEAKQPIARLKAKNVGKKISAIKSRIDMIIQI